MKHSRSLSHFSAGLVISAGLMLSGCSVNDFLAGKDDDAVVVSDLPIMDNKVVIQREWQVSVKDGADSKELRLVPFVSNSVVYAVSNNGSLTAVSAENGEVLWERELGHKISAGVSGNDDIIVVGSEDGLLMALSVDDGSAVWQYQLNDEILASPTVVDDLVVARTVQGHITALSVEDSKVAWEQNIGASPMGIRGNASGVFFDGAFLFTNNSGRMALFSSVDGRPILDTFISRSKGMTDVQRIADIVATPTVSGNILFLSAYNSQTLAINLKSGELLWRSDVYTTRDIFANDELVYLIDKDSIVHALDVKTGEVKWESAVAQGRELSPVFSDGTNVLTADKEGNLLVLDAYTGELMGYQNVGLIFYQKFGGNYLYVAPQLVDGKWLTYTKDGHLTLTTVREIDPDAEAEDSLTGGLFQTLTNMISKDSTDEEAQNNDESTESPEGEAVDADVDAPAFESLENNDDVDTDEDDSEQSWFGKLWSKLF